MKKVNLKKLTRVFGAAELYLILAAILLLLYGFPAEYIKFGTSTGTAQAFAVAPLSGAKLTLLIILILGAVSVLLDKILFFFAVNRKNYEL
jgi:hypothetical protein